MKAKNTIAAIASCLVCSCTANAYNVSLEPIIDTDGRIAYRYSDVITIGRQNTQEAESKRIENMNDWMKKSNNCKNGFSVVAREEVTTNTIVDSKRVFYFIKCN